MSNRSKIALVVLLLIWIVDFLLVVCTFNTTGGYSIYSLIILPISLLIYLGNYYGVDDTPNNHHIDHSQQDNVRLEKEEDETPLKSEGEKKGIR